jgi:hypothetical protein
MAGFYRATESIALERAQRAETVGVPGQGGSA